MTKEKEGSVPCHSDPLPSCPHTWHLPKPVPAQTLARPARCPKFAGEGWRVEEAGCETKRSFICSRHWGRFLLLICLLACSSSCMARRKALMTSGRKGWWWTVGQRGSQRPLSLKAEAPCSSHTYLAGLRSAWLAGPGQTLPCSRRSPGRSLAAQSSRRVQANLALAVVTRGNLISTKMTKPT